MNECPAMLLQLERWQQNTSRAYQHSRGETQSIALRAQAQCLSADRSNEMLGSLPVYAQSPLRKVPRILQINLWLRATHGHTKAKVRAQTTPCTMIQSCLRARPET